MAPKDDFVKLLQILSEKYGIVCEQMRPLWACIVPSEKDFEKIPSMKFSFIQNEKGQTKDVFMPPHSFLKVDPSI